MTGKILLGLLILFTMRICPQTLTGDEPDVLFNNYIRSLSEGNWESMSAMMHPEVHKLIRELIYLISDEPESIETLSEMFAVNDVKELDSLSDNEILAGFMSFVDRQQGIMQILRDSDLENLGKVFEGQDTCHIVYRSVINYEGAEIIQYNVFSLAKFNQTWRVLMQADLSGIVSLISANLRKKETELIN